MTLANDDRQVTYNPVSSTDTFAVDFPIFDDDHLRVFIDDVETLDFSVTSTYEDGRSTDAEVVLDTPVSGVEVVIKGQITVQRDADYSGGTPNLARNLQNDMDFLTAVAQELTRDYGALSVLSMPGEVTVSTFMETFLDDANGDAALTTLGGSANGISMLKAANYSAMRTLLSLGSLSLLNSVALANITAGDRPDDDDLSNSGTKLCLRKNAKAYAESQVPQGNKLHASIIYDLSSGSAVEVQNNGFASVTRTATGEADLVFDAALADDDYWVECTAIPATSGNDQWTYFARVKDRANMSNTGLTVVCGYVSGTASGGYNDAVDMPYVAVRVFT